MDWLRRYWYWGIVAIFIILALAVTVQFTKDTNFIAEWVFNFLKDWAIILSAAITLLLVVAAFITIKTTTEQRRKSIKPLLQVDHISYWFQKLDSPDTNKKLIIPGIELKVTNVGTGPALNLKISAHATINVTRGDLFKGVFCELYWELKETNKDVYLERTLKPVPLRLKLVQAGRSFTVDRINQMERGALNREMQIRLEYHDIDQSPFTELKIIPFGSDISPLEFENDTSTVIPGDPDFPSNPIISL